MSAAAMPQPGVTGFTPGPANAPAAFPAFLLGLRAPGAPPGAVPAAPQTPALPEAAQDATGLDAPPPFALAFRVWFSAHHPQTPEALEHAIPKLRELFADQGLNLAQANVDSGRGAFAQRGLHTPPAWPEWLGDDLSEPLAPATSVWQLARAADRRVDVLV